MSGARPCPIFLEHRVRDQTGSDQIGEQDQPGRTRRDQHRHFRKQQAQDQRRGADRDDRREDLDVEFAHRAENGSAHAAERLVAAVENKLRDIDVEAGVDRKQDAGGDAYGKHQTNCDSRHIGRPRVTAATLESLCE